MFFEDFAELNDKLVYIGDTPEKFKYAIIGVTHDSNHVVYSYSRLVELFMENDDMSYEDAVEMVDCNTLRALDYMGEYKPIVIYDLDDE